MQSTSSNEEAANSTEYTVSRYIKAYKDDKQLILLLEPCQCSKFFTSTASLLISSAEILMERLIYAYHKFV